MGLILILDNIGVPLGSLEKSVIVDPDYVLTVSNDSGAHLPRIRPAQFEMHLKTCAQKSAQSRLFNPLYAPSGWVSSSIPLMPLDSASVIM